MPRSIFITDVELSVSRRLVEKTGQRIRRLDSTELQSPKILRSHIEQLQVALARRSDDAQGQYRMAQLWVTLYRVEAAAQMKARFPNLADEELLAITSMDTLFYRSQDPANREKLLQHSLVQNYLQRAWDRLLLARDGCPVMGKTHLSLARLSPLFTRQPARRVWL